MYRFHKPGDEKRSVVVLDDDAWHAWLEANHEEDVRRFLQQFDPGKFRAVADPAAISVFGRQEQRCLDAGCRSHQQHLGPRDHTFGSGRGVEIVEDETGADEPEVDDAVE